MQIKRKIHTNNEFKMKRTKASTFVHFLVKICFIPVTIRDKKIDFKLYHWKTILYILILVGYILTVIFGLHFIGVRNPFFQIKIDLENTSGQNLENLSGTETVNISGAELENQSGTEFETNYGHGVEKRETEFENENGTFVDHSFEPIHEEQSGGAKSKNMAENIIFFLSLFLRTFPLILSYGLQNLKPNRFNTQYHKNPQHTLKIILAFLLVSFGTFIEIIDIEKLKVLSFLNLVGFLGLYLLIVIMEFLFIFGPSLLIDIFAHDFNFECKNSINKENFQENMDFYEELNKSLQYFCLCFYFYYQFTIIFQAGKTLSGFFITKEIDILIIGEISTMAGMILNVMIVTAAIDYSFESLQIVKGKIQENLEVSFDKSERKKLKKLLENVKSLRPMSACGYFEISKSTLTSMLEVRLIFK